MAPSPETVIDGTYPLARSLYIYVSKERLKANPAVTPFVDFYLGEGIGRSRRWSTSRCRRPTRDL